MKSKSCAAIQARFSGYLDGAISGQEMLAISRHIENVVIDVERLSPYFIELRVDQSPALFSRIPDFANDVVFEKTWIEVCPETAAHPGRNLLGTQYGSEKHRKMTAHADQAPVDGSCDGKWPGVQRENSVEELLCGANMALALAFFWNSEAIKIFCGVFMQDHALNDAYKAAKVVWQGLQRRGVLTRGRHCAGAGIVGMGLGRLGGQVRSFRGRRRHAHSPSIDLAFSGRRSAPPADISQKYFSRTNRAAER